jgi:predicted dithiol-disulfide oxidoreductase (DUF899 family)
MGEQSADRNDQNNAGKTVPNESAEYRKARDELRTHEQELIDKTAQVAAARRKLPQGGRLEEDCVFQWVSGGESPRKLGADIEFAELFGNKDTLIIYSFMFGPNWDKPCMSCTSLMDGFDRAWYAVAQDASFVAISKAPPEKIDAWAKPRGWTQIPIVSGFRSSFQRDYSCQQPDNDDMQWPVMLVFRKQQSKSGVGIFHFWSTETSSNHVDTVWPYWNLLDFTPEGRPDRDTPPQKFVSEFLVKNYGN